MHPSRTLMFSGKCYNVHRSFSEAAMPLIHAREREVICRLLLDILRIMHEAYAPTEEPFGTRIETDFIGLCVAIGDIDGRPFNISKIAAYMQVPRTTVMR